MPEPGCPQPGFNKSSEPACVVCVVSCRVRPVNRDNRDTRTAMKLARGVSRRVSEVEGRLADPCKPAREPGPVAVAERRTTMAECGQLAPRVATQLPAPPPAKRADHLRVFEQRRGIPRGECSITLPIA